VTVDDVPALLPSDRLREWSVLVTERYSGKQREIRVEARGLNEAGFLAHAEMDEHESIDSITD
jgi:hypothetical protein